MWSKCQEGVKDTWPVVLIKTILPFFLSTANTPSHVSMKSNKKQILCSLILQLGKLHCAPFLASLQTVEGAARKTLDITAGSDPMHGFFVVCIHEDTEVCIRAAYTKFAYFFYFRIRKILLFPSNITTFNGLHLISQLSSIYFNGAMLQ